MDVLQKANVATGVDHSFNCTNHQHPPPWMVPQVPDLAAGAANVAYQPRRARAVGCMRLFGGLSADLLLRRIHRKSAAPKLRA
jgi:hypothetical protein